ncbi:heme-binding domain-containing protein [Gillisia sp. CAL575]|uniref:heme-binding domain-containing protein n=1 Tax=Gillisia sp. CAL575 TaxID=985255 RepID=UPI00055526FA|nr:heme-binding domain-containing protein [Gillisia sp. CAL575]
MKILKVIATIALTALIGIQFIPTSRNQSDVVPVTDFINNYNPPKEVASILRTSCYDCHSNNTNYPWYNKIQPVAWYLEDHVSHGKEEFNFSEFGDYSDRRKKSKLKSLLRQVEQDEMPLDPYTLIHSDAKISESEKELLLGWVNKVLESI